MTAANLDNLLVMCPGTTGQLARAIDSVFRVTDPMLALAVAFSTAGAVRAGRIKHRWCHANAYHAVIGLTGIGKTIAQQCGIVAIEQCGLAGMLCGDFTSEAALVHRLDTCPITYASYDEIGLALQNMAEDRGGNRREVFATMLRAYSATNGVLLGKQYSPRSGTTSSLTAKEPLLSILGSSTPSAFFAGMTARAAADGLLGRFYLWFAGNQDPQAIERERAEFKTPKDVTKEFQAFADWELELVRPRVKEIRVKDEIIFNEILTHFERQIRLETNESKRALIARGPELFIKLCLALVESDLELGGTQIVYAQELLETLYKAAWEQCEDALGRGRHADERLKIVEKFLSKVPVGKENAITRTELYKRTRKLGLKGFERKDLLHDLIDSGQLIEYECHHDEHSNSKTLLYFKPPRD